MLYRPYHLSQILGNVLFINVLDLILECVEKQNTASLETTTVPQSDKFCICFFQ